MQHDSHHELASVPAAVEQQQQRESSRLQELLPNRVGRLQTPLMAILSAAGLLGACTSDDLIRAFCILHAQDGSTDLSCRFQ